MPGFDIIFSKLLNAAGNAIYDFSRYIHNLILRTGVSPEGSKAARVTPMYVKKETCLNVGTTDLYLGYQRQQKVKKTNLPSSQFIYR